MAAFAFALRIGDRMYNGTLESGGKCTVGGHKKDTIHIDGWEKHQLELRASGDTVRLLTRAPLIPGAQSCPMEQPLTLDGEGTCQLMVTDRTGREAESLPLPYQGVVRCGRSTRGEVVLDIPFISKNHFLLRTEGGSLRVEDSGSTHGLFLNGSRIRAGVMRSGDVLQVWTARILLEGGKLYFENVGGRLHIGALQAGAADTSEAVPAQRQGAFLLYHRSPRMQERLPSEPVVLADPPAKTAAYERKRSMLTYLLGPGIMLAANLTTMGAASPALLMARSAGLVTPLVSMASYGSMDKKQKKRLEEYEKLRRQRFGAYIEEQKRHIEEVAQHQRAILTRENPSPAQCVQTVAQVRRSLWERMPTDRDFLDLRLGMGYEPLCVPVKSRAETGGFRMEDDEMEQVVRQIVEETRIVDNIPARLSLRTYQTVGVVGKRRRAIRLVQNLLVELTCQHSPQNVRLVGIFDKEEIGAWAPLRWLPHVWDEEGQFRYIAFDGQRAHTVCELLSDVLQKRRKAQAENGGRDVPPPQPHYVVLLGSKTLIRSEPLMKLLTQNDPALGVSTIFLFDDLYSLPQECRCIVEVDHDPCAYDRLDVSRKFFFTPDEPTEEDELDRFTRRMSSIRVEEATQTAQMPDSVTFLQGYGVRHPEQLRVTHRWRNSRPYETLAAPIGVGAGGATFSFDIQDGRHGPHGLVAGTTGAGKSELLQSWILSMAVNYDPTDVVFVIIDYKGGGMANLLEPLPHVIGKITNLGSGIERALAALTAENRRRQRLFEQYGVNDIKKYQKLYREGRADEPLPYLIIVTDEFAELKREQEEFMQGLISISRIGRSLGVRLVLATQQPTNVVNGQIDSNSRFRICLKMNSAEDSKAVLKHADAARITHPGRAYIRVGEDELFTLFQSYWSGAVYHAEEDRAADAGNPVSIINTTGERIRMQEKKRVRRAEEIDELTAVIRHVCREAEAEGIRRLPPLWMPELPEQLPLADVLPPYAFNGIGWGENEHILRLPVGRFDDPANQRQGVQYLDMAEGSCAVYGAPMSGKTGLLRAFLLSMAMCCTPSQMQAYIIDCGWGLGRFGELPHVGGVVLSFEEDKREKLRLLLLDELDRRKELFRSNAVSSLNAYRSAVGPDLAAVVLVIDDIVALLESISDQTQREVFRKFLEKWTHEGASYGLYLLYTAGSTGGIGTMITQYIKNTVALQMKDPGDYAALVGKGRKSLPPVAGRGFVRGEPPMEFQTALYLDRPTEPEQYRALEELAREMDRRWTGPRPRRIPMLAESIAPEDPEYAEPARLPVGQDVQTLETAYVDMAERYRLLICGPLQAENSRTLENLCRVLLRQERNRLFVVDSPSAPLAALRDSAARYCRCDDTEGVQRLLDEVKAELNRRLQLRWDGQESASALPQLCVILDDLDALQQSITDAQLTSFVKICTIAKGLSALVLASAQSDFVETNRYGELVGGLLADGSGIATGAGAAMCGCFHAVYRAGQTGQLSAKDGLLFGGGAYRVIRRIGS